MEDFVTESDTPSYQRHTVVRNENENRSSQLSGWINMDDRYSSNDIVNTTNIDQDDGTESELPALSNSENTTTKTMINTIIPTTDTGGSTHNDDGYNHHSNYTTNHIQSNNNNDEEEFTTVSMSPDERNTFFPSSSSSRRTSLPEYKYNPTSGGSTSSEDHTVYHPTATRPSRESVLQRLCEALLRRSLTKVRENKCDHMFSTTNT